MIHCIFRGFHRHGGFAAADLFRLLGQWRAWLVSSFRHVSSCCLGPEMAWDGLRHSPRNLGSTAKIRLGECHVPKLHLSLVARLYHFSFKFFVFFVLVQSSLSSLKTLIWGILGTWGIAQLRISLLRGHCDMSWRTEFESFESSPRSSTVDVLYEEFPF